MRLRTAFLWSMIVSLSLAALLGIAALLLPHLVRATEQIIGTAALVGAFSVACLLQSMALDKGRLVWAMWIGMAGALIALALWLIAVWVPSLIRPWDAPLWRAGWVFTIVAGWGVFCALASMRAIEHPAIRRLHALAIALASGLALFSICVVWWGAEEWWVAQMFGTFVILLGWTAWIAALIGLRITRPGFAKVRDVTVIVVTLTAAILIAMTWEWIRVGRDWDQRIIGILTILTAGGTVITVVLGVLDRHSRREAGESMPQAGRVRIDLTCPRCRSPQQVNAGASRCGSCGLRFVIEVEEPRCECGFVLYQLTGSRCPECGREIPETARWKGGPSVGTADAADVA